MVNTKPNQVQADSTKSGVPGKSTPEALGAKGSVLKYENILVAANAIHISYDSSSSPGNLESGEQQAVPKRF